MDVIKSAVYGPKKPRDLMTLRPTELDLWTRGSADVVKLPVVPFLGYRFVYELYTYSDLLKTIIRSLVQETFRKGITIQPRFISKCNICHTEYDTKVDKCEVCGSDSLRGPNVYEKEYMERLLHDVNFNNQSLVEVLKDVDTDLNIFDNAYLAVVKRYDFDADGNVVGAEVVEVVRANPEFVMLVMDREGRPGRTDNGDLVMFCLEHRDRYKAVPPDQAREAKCFCGKKLYPAYFAVNKWGTGGVVYYTNGEILHIKKFTHGLGYGLSPIFSVWMKVLTLLKMDFFILTAYHLERPPRALLILRGQMESIQKAWARLMEEAKVNPHMIFPLVVEGQDKASRIAEFIDLSFHVKDFDLIEFREEIRRTVGALWGVMPIFHGDVGGGAGLANEGLQIVVTNRAVQAEQEIFNDKVLPWLSQQLGIMDWEFQLIPNEGRDIVARIQRETMRIANAERMAQLGYKPVAIKTDDGIDFYYEIGGEQIPEGKKAGYIASKVYQAVPEREIPRHEGEPEHGRPRTEEQRFEGEELARRPKGSETFVVGEGGKLIPEDDVDKNFYLEKDNRQKVDVPIEYRRYIKPEDISRLPVGTRVHRGPRGGLFVDIRELPEHIRERVGREEEEDAGESEDRPRRSVSEHWWKKYSGKVGEDISYTVAVDPSGEIGTLTLSSRQGHSIKFEVDVKANRVRVLETDIPEPRAPDVAEKAVEIVSRVPTNILANTLYAAFRWFGINELPEKPHRILVSRRINEIALDKSIKTVSGEDLGLDAYEGAYQRLGEMKKDKFHRIGETKVFVHESLDADKIGERLKGYLEMVDEENFAGIVVVSQKALEDISVFGSTVAGFYDPQNDVIVLSEEYMEWVFLHEYFHAVYAVYERLDALDSILAVVREMFHDALREAGFTADLFKNIEVEDESARKIVERLASSYDQREIYDVIDHYLETSHRFLPKLVRELRKIVDRYGGTRALRAFRKMVEEFSKDDGATWYSHSFYSVASVSEDRTKKFMAMSEAFSSFADYIEMVRRMMDRDDIFRREISSRYGDDFRGWLNRDIYDRVAERYKVRFRSLDENRVRQLEAVARFLRYSKGVFRK